MTEAAFTVRLPRELAVALERLAHENERSLAGEARVAIRRHVETTATPTTAERGTK